VNDSDRIGLMNVVMCGVDSESGRFGKIQTDYVKRFIVLWTDGTVSENSLPKTKKALMNSPSFFAMVRPLRNQQLFEKEPLQLALEVLYEKRSLTPHSSSLDMEKIGRALIQAGVPKDKFEKARKELRSDLKSDKRVKVSGSTYQITVEDFRVHEPIEVDWAGLEADPNVISQLGSMAGAPEGTISIESTLSGNLEEMWRGFFLQTTGQSTGAPLPVEPDRILQIFLNLDESYKKLDKKSQKFLATGEFEFTDLALGLIANWVTRRTLRTDTRSGKESINLALSILMRDNGNLSQTSAMDVARARLSELISENDYLIAGGSLLQTLKLSKALSTLPPGEYDYHGRLSLCVELAKTVRKNYSALTKEENYLLLQIAQNHHWGSSERKVLNEALLSSKSKIIEDESFWTSLDLESLKDLTQSPHWKMVAGREGTRGLLSNAVVNLLTRLNAMELLGVLPYADSLAEAIGQERMPDLLTRALASSAALNKAFMKVSNTDLVVDLRKQSASLSEKALELEGKLQGVTKKLDASSEVIRELQSRIATVAQERTSGENQNLEKFEIQAAKSLAQIMNVIEKYGGEQTSTKEEVQAALAMVGLSPLAKLGDIVKFSFEIHEDPEGLAVEGDSVRLIASGYRWTGSTESVIVQKALVSKVGI